MKQSHALAYLRQICCSGLSREVALTEFLRAVPMLIPSNSNTLTISEDGVRPGYHLAGFDLSDMADAVPDIIANYHTPERQKRAIAGFSQYPTINDPRVMEPAFYQTDMYNLVFRRYDMHHLMWARVQLNANSTGVIGLYRPSNQKPFDGRDQSQLLHVLPYLTHAYRAANDVDFELSPDGNSGMLVMNTQGDILYQSPDAKRLLQKARYPRLLIDSRKQDRLLAKLAELCRNLQNVYLGRKASPPSFTHTGPNGRFTFRGYWLDKSDEHADGLIGVIVEHRQPLTLKILRAMRESPLSPTQKEVTLLLAQGLALEQICGRLHIKQTTLKDHIGKIYCKLDIHQREDLVPKLLVMGR
ncbi:helix-turn-helix transcriptional regulator [Methylomonas montana]|uniref:helix-turn-helix transcriptional regulator n=1 Tax=Methylomonas montana TaxID=3058963 RepID=UPI00265803B8|nr:helix-turn-helix transcriptional regulator [Methylomonas montana]WKJ90055.1 helix-turn-helix transcriptional regulator [Methylomonas montana]